MFLSNLMRIVSKIGKDIATNKNKSKAINKDARARVLSVKSSALFLQSKK